SWGWGGCRGRGGGGGEGGPCSARAGVDLPADAARSWAGDAYLIYVENDEPLDSVGSGERWGYLYYSPSLDQARAYSVRDGKIVVAERLDMKFEAPQVTSNWIDSGAALAAAAHKIGPPFPPQHQPPLRTLLPIP